jgi:hypothetical protein
MKKWKTGEKHPLKISRSAKITELRQTRWFRAGGFSLAKAWIAAMADYKLPPWLRRAS